MSEALNSIARNRKFYFILSISAYKVALDLLYIYGTSSFYGYLGRNLDFNLTKYILGLIVFLVLANFIEEIRIDLMRFMIKSIFLLSGVANMSLFGLRDTGIDDFLLVCSFWVLTIVGCVFVSNIKQYKDYQCSLERRNITFSKKDELFILLGLLITVYVVSKFGLNVFSLTDVYSARSNFRAQHLSTFDSYLLSWNGTVILPWCFLVSFIRKRYIISTVSLVCATMMFMINGLKTLLIMYAIIFVFSILLKHKKNYDYTLNIILLGMASLIIGSLLFFFKTGQYELAGLLDRTVILPGEVNYYYLDFFSDNEHLYLRESIMKGVAPSPYSPLSSIQISQKYMPNAFYHNATNGLIGDMYGNFGIAGIIIYPGILIVTFIVLSKKLANFGKIISSVVSFILMWLLVNTSFFTWLMTGGYLIYVIILEFYKKYRIQIH